MNGFNIILLDDTLISKYTLEAFNHSKFANKQIKDAIVGATAKALNLQLWTHNKKDFIYLKGIKFYNP